MTKIFDYKFLIIIGLSLIIYFLYREVENLNKRVAKIETQNNSEIAMNSNTHEMIELPPPPELSSVSSSESWDNAVVPYKININNMNDMNDMNDMNNEIMQTITKSIIQSINEEDVLDLNGSVEEEYSNENIQSNEQIYSHDGMDSNTNDNVDTLLVDSIVNMVEPVIEVIETVENLLKHKLDELQEIASKMGISININGKRKKKADLANEIYNMKQTNQQSKP